MKKYFCAECGKNFSAIPSKYSGAVECPLGCGFNCFEATPDGAIESVKALTEYENAIDF